MTTKIGRLLALSEAEFGRKRTSAARKNFKPLKVNVGRLGPDWDRLRGAAARMAAAVLQHDSEALLQKVTTDPQGYADALAWLEREADYLRKTANRHELAVARLKSAVCRYKAEKREASTSAPAPAAEVAP